MSQQVWYTLTKKKKLWFCEKVARWWPLKWVKILSISKRQGAVVGFRMSFSGGKSTLLNTPYIDAVGYTSPSQLTAGYPAPWKRWLLQHMAIFGIYVRFSGVYVFPTLHKPLPVNEFSKLWLWIVKLPRLPTGKLTWQQNIICFNGEILIPLWLIAQAAVFGLFQICVSKLAVKNWANLFLSPIFSHLQWAKHPMKISADFNGQKLGS